MTSVLGAAFARAGRLSASSSSSAHPASWTAARCYASSSPSSSSQQPSSSPRTAPAPAPAPAPPPQQDAPSPTPPAQPLSQSADAAGKDKPSLPWLSRPLGVPYKPLSLDAASRRPHPTRTQRIDDYLSWGRQKERENIIKEASKGYFHDFYLLRDHGGKAWRAPATLIREEKALWFPQVTGTCLADRSSKDTVEMTAGKVSVIALISNQVSLEHTKSFYTPTLDLYSSHPNFQLLHLNLQPNLLKRYLIALFLSTLRSQFPKELHAGYLLSNLDLDDLGARRGLVHREDIGATNKHVGYTYLVDQDGKIRWAGGGFAEKREMEALLVCTGVLLGRRAKPATTSNVKKT